MLGFHEPLTLGFDMAKVKNSALGWVIVNSAKPDRGNDYSLVVQTTNAWAEENLEKQPDCIEEALINELNKLLPKPLPAPTYRSLHRWRYAATPQPLSGDKPYLYEPTQQLAIAGDWLCGSSVEAAFTSADKLANKLLEVWQS